MHTVSSREFNQDTGRIKKAAKLNPVFITDRGKPSMVLMSIEEYQKISHAQKNIGELLAMPGIEDIELDISPLNDVAQTADLA